MNRIKIAALLLCLALLAGCTQTPVSPVTLPAPIAMPEDPVFSMLFDLENQISLQLDMCDEELAKMQQDYEQYDQQGSKSPIYRKGDLHITIQTPQGEQHTYFIEEVGVRMKGNTSRTDFYNPAEGIYNIIHLKLSFQETFDDPDYYGSDAKQWEDSARKARKDRTFATLEKLDLRWNRCDDGSYLKEYFAYETYRQYGVPAPHTNLVSFQWAGIHMGVFTINEPVDKLFLSKYFPEEAQGGDLYKCGWAGNQNASFMNTASIGIEDEDKGLFFAYDLKTNKKISTHEALRNLIHQLNASTQTKDSFAQLVNIETFLPYCAVSYLLGNPDDMRNNYNNFYVYFRADNNQVVVIPYDFDRCLGVTTHWNPTGDAVTSDNPFGKTLLATGQTQGNPLIRYSVMAGGFYVQEYANILQQITDGTWFTEENFADLYQIAEENYAHLAQPEQTFRNTEGLHLAFDLKRTSSFSSNGNISFAEYLDAKTKTLNRYLAKTNRYANQSVEQITDWYIRADFTDWQVKDGSEMVSDDGKWIYHLETDREVRLKLYQQSADRWYGTECVAQDCSVSYRTDEHTNIVLPRGNYRITIDPDTLTIYLETE